MTRYVVVTKDTADPVVFEAWLNTIVNLTVVNEFNRMPNHYLVDILDVTSLIRVQGHPAVRFAVPAESQISLGFTTYADEPTSPVWHRGRIATKFPWPFFSKKDATFSGGEGVDVYVVDTGIDTSHPGFKGKARWLWSCSGFEIDDNTHGTHVAGCVAQMAPEASLIAVKVLFGMGGGTLENYLIGLDRVIEAHKISGRPSVANMSLAFVDAPAEICQIVCAAIATMIEIGIVCVVAAGNNGKPLADIEVFPAEANDVVCVGATDYSRDGLGLIWPDIRADFSNYGVGVKIFAPGVSIWSFAPANRWASMSGTSMATPLVSGAIARQTKRATSRAEVADEVALFYAKQKNRLVRDVRGSFNRFLYLGS